MYRWLVLSFLAFPLAAPASAEDWPQFRGPRGDGTSRAVNLPISWGGAFESPAWKTELPGVGWSSPIVIGNRIWLSACVPTALNVAVENVKLTEHKYGKEVFKTDASVELLALELDAGSGRLLRRIRLGEVNNPPPIHVTNTYASPTPASDGKRLYCHFGSLGTIATDLASGDVLWRRKLEVDDITGPGASPVLCGDQLILVRDGADKQYIAALDVRTGETRWQRDRPSIEVVDPRHKRGFSTPLVVERQGQTLIISPAAQWVLAYEPDAGREVWRARVDNGHAVVPRPVYADGLVYVCSGYPKAKLAAIQVDGAGDVTQSHIRWTCDKQAPLLASPVVGGREIYFVSAGGVASCLDARSGDVVWRTRLGGGYAASPLLADGKLYFTSQEGKTTVLRAGRQFEKLSVNQVYGRSMASLAVFGESLLLRTSDSLSCYRN